MLFEAQVTARPHAVAVCAGERRLTYQELGEHVARLADHLVDSLGITPGEVVGILLERSVECVIAVLAVLRAGAAYLPLDPDYPPKHLQRVLETAEVCAVITAEPHYSLLTEGTSG